MTAKQRLSRLNHPPQIIQGVRLLHQLIDWEAHRLACAIDFTSGSERTQYSYVEVKSCVDSLAWRIQTALRSAQSTASSPTQHVVPLLLSQSPGLYISQLAILELGGAFCPINLDAPEERVKFVVQDVSANIIITTSEFEGLVTWEGGPMVIVIDEFPIPEILETEIVQDFSVQPSDLAYVMYTSGSSGKPKGVAVSHLAASQSLLAHERHIPSFHRFLQFAAPSFDVSVFEIFFPLLRGSTLVGCNRTQLLNDLPGTITQLDIDAAELTPTVAGALLRKRSNAPCLNLLLTIGEMLTTPIIEEFGGSGKRSSMLYGMYGPTEAAIHCNINPEMSSTSSPRNIGFPLDTVSNFIVAPAIDPESSHVLDFLPIGELGELLLGGPQLAHGYLNRPEQNKSAFITFKNEMFYRTGDKARMLPDGSVEIHGRISAGQVKLRGQRVELGEIEEAVYKHPGMKAVATCVLRGVLIAFVLPEDVETTAADILQTCGEWLPKFMIPGEVLVLDKFPYLPSGKIDRKKLETDYQKSYEQSTNGNGHSAPVEETEMAVHNVLSNVLGQFDTSQRLAAAGVDSLIAIRVSSQLQKLGYGVTTITILECDSFTRLVNACNNSKVAEAQQIQHTATPTSLTNGVSHLEKVVMSCTPLQNAMLAETAANIEKYQNWVELEMSYTTDVQYIVDCFIALAQLNPVLRTSFELSKDSFGYNQRINDTFAASNVKHVQEFDFELRRLEDVLQLPVQLQIMPCQSSFRLLLLLHHALYDAWSLELLLDDFNSLLMSNIPAPRPSITRFVDFTMNGSLLLDNNASQQYWIDHLTDLEIRTIPNFRIKKTDSKGLSVARLMTSIPTATVEIASKGLSCSPQSFFQAAYSLVLASYLGSTDICFGTVFSGRTLPFPEIEDLVFPTLATLPIRVDLSISSTLQDLVQNLNSINRKHLPHSSIPLGVIKQVAGVLPRQQVFDTILIWQQTLHSHENAKEHVKLVDNYDNLEFNLTLEVIPGMGNIELKANYQQSILPESQVELLLSQIEHIVKVTLDSTSTLIQHSFEKMPEDILSIENPKPQTALCGGTLSSSVELIALEDPTRPALEFATSVQNEAYESQKMSYFELNGRGNQIAHLLQQQGVGPDDLVCICLEKCTDLYASILAVTKLGAGYLPVTYDIPQERLRHILKEAQVRTLVVHSLSRHFKDLELVNVINLDNVDLSRCSTSNLQRPLIPEHVAYCVYTSGSTGTPKGVVVTQENLLSNLGVLENLYPATKATKLLQSCSQAFDVSVFEVFFTWRVGGCLCAATKDVLFRDIELAIRLMKVTHLSLTPTVAALINPQNVPNVEFLVTAGEAVTPKVFSTWADRGLYQGYGPSETTNICTVNPQVSHDDFINNIGRPFKNTSAFVLQPGSDFALVPRGGEGEFCFGGSQVFRGYLGPEQNIGKIMEHPVYGRLYRSGDFGRLMPDGSLAFTGRKDDQVKIRGQRVELGEINNVMLKSAKVGDCVTIIMHTENQQQALVSFWATNSEAKKDLQFLEADNETVNELFDQLEATLPVYMLPSALIPVSHLPSTTQGKIDKRLLISKYKSLGIDYLNNCAPSNRASPDHQWTGIEMEIAKVVSETTGTPQDHVTADLSFFALGIDSISAIYFAKTLQRKIDTQVDISDVLKYSSVRRLAQRLSAQRSNGVNGVSGTSSSNFKIDQQTVASTIKLFEEAGWKIERVHPCTPLQAAMLSAAESTTDDHYGNKVAFRVYGDVLRIKQCWTEMIARHAILRTCFMSTELKDHPYIQVILQEYHFDFDSARTVQHNAPPYSISFKVLDDETRIELAMHHALYDGVALETLYKEIELLYQQQLLPPPVSFQPFLETALSADLTVADEFWKGVLSDFTPSRLNSPIQIPSKVAPSSRVQALQCSIPLSSIESSIKKHSTTLLAVCHTVWASILSGFLQETDICFGNVVNGRNVPIEGIERLVAPCFNTVPVRLSNTHKTTYLEAFRAFQSLNVNTIPFQFTPLRRVQQKLSPDGLRLFDTLFILQQPAKELDTRIWQIVEDAGIMDFPVVIEVTPRKKNDVLEVILHSYHSAISDDISGQLLNSFGSVLTEALENPRRPILSAEAKQVISEKEATNVATMAISSQKSSENIGMSADLSYIRDIIAKFTEVPTDKIGRDTSIFRLGLDSISTVQVATQLRKKGYKVLGGDILAHPTIRKLDAFLSTAPNDSEDMAPVFDFGSFDADYRAEICSKYGLKSESVEAIRPCTAVQTGMIAQTLHSGGEDYINSITFELKDFVTLEDFKTAWKRICTSHEMLRTGFAQVGNPQYPFVMLTYTKIGMILPWIEQKDDDLEKFSAAKDLVKHPWALLHSQVNGKNLICFQAHHALYDARSLELILSDIAAVCNGLETKTETSVTPVLQAILQSTEGDLNEKQVFWQNEKNKAVVNRFPDLTPLRVSCNKIETKEIYSQSSRSDLELLCKKHGITMQAASQAAWARILAAYTGESSTTFGMTLSGQSVHEKSSQTGFPTIVTLPVRCNVTGTNQDLLIRTMNTNAALHKHQFTPLTSIQRWSGYPEGKMFDTLFAYQKTSLTTQVSQPWTIVKEEASVDYAVSMEVLPEMSDKMALRLTFRTNLVPIEHAELLLQQYDAFLRDLLENPNAACDVTPECGTQLLAVTPARHSTLQGPATLLHDFVTLGAKKWPSKIALEFATNLQPGRFRSKSWTFKQLEEESNRVANLLVHHGVKPGQLVGICFDKCAEASFAIIGIMKSGCAYVALDPTAPIERLKFITKDSSARIILTAGVPAHKITSEIDAHMINLDELDVLKNCSSSPLQLSRDIVPADVSYCLYTSGTTGTPKGCLITHENAVQAMYSFQLLFAGHWNSNSKWLQFASFHFDVSVLEQFWSWSVGICLASAPRDLIFEDIPNAIKQLGITHIDLTPSLARLVHPDDVPSLKKGVFITGGEPLKQEILDVWGEHACIYNGYGPTEATIGCTMYTRVPKNGSPSNIGPAFENVGSFVLKPGTDLPIFRGGVGELCVSGKLVGKGYLNRPDLTKERFPGLHSFNERVYRTGDLVRILHNGDFIFLGRADDQVKLRGQRLELTEINEVIKKSMAGLDQVVTLVLKHTMQQKEQLVTFFVASEADNNQKAKDISQMRDACKARLPGYMVPTHYIPIKALPLNANNKADAKQLAALYNEMDIEELQSLSHAGHSSRDWNNQERDIVDVIAKAMDLDSKIITRGSNIFELGIDSISIIGFARKLKQQGLRNANISVIKSNTLMERLVSVLLSSDSLNQDRESAYLSAKQKITAFSQRHLVGICKDLGVDPSNIEAVAPCSPVQEGLIYRFLESTSDLYFNEFDFQLDASININTLQSAWDRVICKVQVLRTQFIETDDGYAQVVSQSNGGYGHRQESFHSVSSDKVTALRRPFQWAIERKVEGEFMKLRIFHGLYDGNSLTMMLRCLVDEYHGLSVDFGPSFQSALPYGPLVSLTEAQKFWTQHLSEWSPSPLSFSPEYSEDVTATVILELGGFEALLKQLSVSHQAIVQATWISVLQKYTSQSITIGIVTSGRAIDFEGAENVIGPLFNTLPHHTAVQHGIIIKELIQSCHDFNMRSQEFQHTALKDIQKWSPARPGENLFDTLFVFQRPEKSDEDFANGFWSMVDSDQAADYPLAFEATLSPDCMNLRLTIVAQGQYFTQTQLQDLLSDFSEAINDLLKNGGEHTIEISRTFENVEPSTLISTTSKATPITNGTFSWTSQAKAIRTEIASLANLSEESVYSTSSIFGLGLDSIDIIKLSSRLKRQGIVIPVSAIIRSQVVSKIVSQIISTETPDTPAMISSLKLVSQKLESYIGKSQSFNEVEEVLPATPLQQSLVNEMMKSKYQRYFNVEAYKLEDGIALHELKRAVEVVVRHSPILRTNFKQIEDPELLVSYAQVIHKTDSDYTKTIVTSTKLAEAQSFSDYIAQFTVESVGLAIKGNKVLQIRLVDAEDANYMVIAIAHALYDGRSLENLHADFYDAYICKPVARPDYKPFLEQVFQSTTEDAKTFWRTSLSSLPLAKFPTKEMSNEILSNRCERISRISLSKVEDLCKACRVTIQTLGQTCWALVLAYFTGQVDVIFGSVLSCRDTEEANDVMFPLMNTVPIRSVIHGTVEELLQHMQGMNDKIREYQHFPLSTAQSYALASRADQGGTGDTVLFDTLFIYQGRKSKPSEKPLYKSIFGASEVEIPVCVEMEISDGDHLSWTAACKAFVCAQPEKVVDMLELVLGKLVLDTKSPTITAALGGISICGLPPVMNIDTGVALAEKPTFNVPYVEEKWSLTETNIRKILHQLSQVPLADITKHTTIFHLGLDSILVLKAPALLRNYGIQLRVSDILKAQTISAMAELTKKPPRTLDDDFDVDIAIDIVMKHTGVESMRVQLEQKFGPIQQILPATAGQIFMIRHWQSSGGVLFYPTFKFNIHGAIDKNQLAHAWELLLTRHDILRTGFLECEDKIFQIVYQSSQSDAVRQTQTVTAQDLQFPPINYSINQEQTSAYLRLTIHHALYDGISLPLLVDELETLYKAQTLPPIRLDFKDFVARSSAVASDNSLQQRWKDYLQIKNEHVDNHSQEGIENNLLDITIKSGVRTAVYNPGNPTIDIRGRAQELGVSTDALLLASISKVRAQQIISRGTTERLPFLIIGIYHSNRAPFSADLSEMCAPTLNLLPLVIRQPTVTSVEDISRAIQNDLQMISDGGMASVSLEQIYEWTGTRVNFWVNIVKDNVIQPQNNNLIITASDEDSQKRAETVQEIQHDVIKAADPAKYEAYIPSIDLEIRYQGLEGGGKLDIGVFGPTDLISVQEAEILVNDILGVIA